MLIRSSWVQVWVKRVALVAAVVVVGSVVGALAITPRPAEVDRVAVVVADEAGMRRSLDAYAARYASLAQDSLASTSGKERAVTAYAARFAGMAEHYTGKPHMSRRNVNAYAARYAGLAERNVGKGHSSQRAMSAYAARCAGMAEHYATPGK